MLSNSLRVVIISTLFAMAFSTPSQARIKCWKNSDGFRECGNFVPPEYAQQDSKELNKNGVTTGKHERAKTQDELDQEEALAAIEKEKQSVIKRRKDADRLLLNSFASADDIILAREGKLSSLASEISLRKAHIVKLRANLDKIIASAADMERKGERPTQKILDDIGSVKSQITENKRYIAVKQKEQELVRQQYDQDLVRYNKLQSSTDFQASVD